MGPIDTIIDKAEEKCAARHARLTTKRKMVLRCLLGQDHPISAYGIIDKCRVRFGSDMPPTSVYRILSFLQENLLVHKLELQNKYIACSHISCKHDHGHPQFLICIKCKLVKEVDDNASFVSEMIKVFGRSNFQFVTPQVEMVGVCDKCHTTDQIK